MACPALLSIVLGHFWCCNCSASLNINAALLSALQTCYPDCAIYDRSARRRAERRDGADVQGPVTGELPPALLPIEEHGMKLLVDIRGGHKTGYYLDRATLSFGDAPLRENQRVLNCFSYTGGFAVSVNGRLSPCRQSGYLTGLDIASKNVELNQLDLSS